MKIRTFFPVFSSGTGDVPVSTGSYMKLSHVIALENLDKLGILVLYQRQTTRN